MLRCEFCGESINAYEYSTLQCNRRYLDIDVYISHKGCTDECPIVEVIDTTESLQLVRVNEDE